MLTLWDCLVSITDRWSTYISGGDFSPYLFFFQFFVDNEKFVNEQGMLNASAIKKEQYDLDYPLSSAVRLKDNTVYGYCTRARFICKYNLSEQVIPWNCYILGGSEVPANISVDKWILKDIFLKKKKKNPLCTKNVYSIPKCQFSVYCYCSETWQKKSPCSFTEKVKYCFLKLM